MIILNNEYYATPLSDYVSGYQGLTYNWLFGILKQSQSIVPLQDFQGNHIGYPVVKEIYGTNGQGGSRVYYFQADQDYSHSRSKLDMSNYTALTSVNGSNGIKTPGIFGNGLFNEINPKNLIYAGFQSASQYPFTPDQVDFRRGRLLAEETYDSAGTLIRKVQNIYKESYNDSALIRGFKTHRIYVTGNTQKTYDALAYYKLHTGISHLASTTITDLKDGKSMVTTTNYGYESKMHTQKTSDTTINSIGDTLIHKSYYSFDYGNNSTSDSIFLKMKNRNMLLPVSTREWKNNKLIGGMVTQFKDFSTGAPDTFINPVKIYALQLLVH